MKDFFQRYADRIDVRGPGECWPWTGATAAGYGHGNRDGEHFYAHRAAYESEHGDGSADGLVVRHRCDNPPCCNPHHLLGGTHQDNMDDMWARGRANTARGERSGRALVCDSDVLEMRSLALNGFGISEIRNQHFPALDWKVINGAVRGWTWAHLPGAVVNPPPSGTRLNKPRLKGARLELADASAIKRDLRAGFSGTFLSEKYGVSVPTISAIKVGRIWRHAP